MGPTKLIYIGTLKLFFLNRNVPITSLPHLRKSRYSTWYYKGTGTYVGTPENRWSVIVLFPTSLSTRCAGTINPHYPATLHTKRLLTGGHLGVYSHRTARDVTHLTFDIVRNNGARFDAVINY